MSNPWSRIMSIKDFAYTSGNDLASTASGDVCPTSGTVTAGGGAHRLYVATDTATTVIVRYNGDNITLNSGNQIAANSMYAFSISFRQGDTYTIRFGSSNQIHTLILDQLPEGVY